MMTGVNGETLLMATKVVVNNIDTKYVNSALHNLPDVNVDMEQIEKIRALTQQLQETLEDRIAQLEILVAEYDTLYEVCKAKVKSRIH